MERGKKNPQKPNEKVALADKSPSTTLARTRLCGGAGVTAGPAAIPQRGWGQKKGSYSS